MNDKPEIKPKGITPLKRICMTIGELPSSYLRTMTYYEMLIWFTNFLKEKMIPVLDNNALAVEELQRLFIALQTYVNDYFDNLDVQEEINNKLDQMLDDGVLEQIIEEYLNSSALWCFDNVADMKEATNLIDGSYAKTLGYHTKNDNGGAVYKIREITNSDIVDEGSIIALYDENLIAELIINDNLNVLNFGYQSTSITFRETNYSCKNITEGLNKAINYLSSLSNDRGIIIFFPDDTYLIDETIDCTDKFINLYGNSLLTKTVDWRIMKFKQKIFTNVDGYVFNKGKLSIKGLNFLNILETDEYNAKFSNNSVSDMHDCHINNYDSVFYQAGNCTIDYNYFLNCRKYFIEGTISDGMVTNNYINAKPDSPNTECVNVTSFGTTLFDGNFVDFFKKSIVAVNQIIGSRITNNVFDYTNRAIKIGGSIGTTIANNSFLHISKDYYERLHYESTDTEASEDWYCIETTYTINALTVIGNTCNNFDKFIKIPNINNSSNILFADNIMEDFSKYGEFTIDASARGSKNVKFYDLEGKIYTISPSITNMYFNQTCYYNGVKYKNIGTQVIAIGIENLEKGDFKNYTTSGGGNTTVDFTNYLNGALYSNLILEIRTSRGYLSPTLAKYNIIRVGTSLTIKELFNDSPTVYKTSVTASGLTLTISFSGDDENNSSQSKQVFIRTYGE